MRSIWITVLVLIVVSMVGVTAFLYGQNKGSMKDSAARTENTTVSPTSFSGPSPSAQSSTGAVIIIENEESLLQSDALQLKEKIINPYVDYQISQNNFLVSLKISKNLLSGQDVYPYKADAIFKNGVNEGFLISKAGNVINWWRPECMGECPFTQEFRLKYPEVVN